MSELQKIFKEGGALSKVIDGFQHREPQWLMAKSVEAVINQERVLLAEAGTGTGKTLAYLIPAVLSEKKVIISTGTRNLQEQIFFKDISLLTRALGIDLEATYLKGQENYLCIRRYEELIRSPKALAFPTEQISALSQWADKTLTGDKMELDILSDDSSLWRQVCSTRDTRIGRRCPHFDDCHLTKARKAAAASKIVVVNHHLYFADVATRQQGGTVLGPHDLVIFDEAHLIEDIATEFFSTKVSNAGVRRMLDDVQQAVRGAKVAEDPFETKRPQQIDRAKDQAKTLFTTLRGDAGRSTLKSCHLTPDVVAAYHKLDNSLEAVQSSLSFLEGRDPAIDHQTKRIEKARNNLALILDGEIKGYVHWIETKPRSSIVGASPIDISDTFKDGVLFQIPSVVLTSATLSSRGDFSFLKNRLGIDFEVDEISLEAPFDYKKQACLYVSQNMPDPFLYDFAERAALEIEELVRITGGGALVLCTSYKNMELIHQALANRVHGPLYLQGTAPKLSLVSSLKNDPRAVLVATTSFREGVDIPGDALRLVVIDKLPFASPGDPVVSARIDALKESGSNAFKEYQVPQAALALKQGFGRLIRTSSDRGIVAILDNRLRTKNYAKTFFETLPKCHQTSTLEETEDWWLLTQPPNI